MPPAAMISLTTTSAACSCWGHRPSPCQPRCRPGSGARRKSALAEALRDEGTYLCRSALSLQRAAQVEDAHAGAPRGEKGGICLAQPASGSRDNDDLAVVAILFRHGCRCVDSDSCDRSGPVSFFGTLGNADG